MKKVLVQSGIVTEILPAGVINDGTWYNEDFWAQVVEDVPEDVGQGWVYDRETGAFSPPPPSEPEEPALSVEERLQYLEVHVAALEAENVAIRRVTDGKLSEH